MKKTVVALVLLVAVTAAILLLSRGHDVLPGRPDATHDVAVGTVARPTPRARHPAPDTDAAPPVAARRIDGVVVDAESDKPIVGAEILVARRRTPEPREGFLDTELPGEPEIRATTSADGKFGIDVPTDGPWFVTARALEHVDAVRLARAGDAMEIKLHADAEETLTVVRARDEVPIPGAEVWVLAAQFKPPARLHLVADEHGVVKMHVSPGEKLVVTAKACATCFTDAQEGEATIDLFAGCRIAGVVRDHGGRGVAGAVLRMLSNDAARWLTDADGRFCADGVPLGDEGRCGFNVSAVGFLEWSDGLQCGAMDEVVELRRSAHVEGTVLMPDGSPAVGAKVADAVTDATGAFRVEIDPDAREVSAVWSPPNGSKDAQFRGSVACETQDGAALSGVVVRLARAEPPPRSYVVLRVVDSAGRPVTEIQTGVQDTVHGNLVVLSYGEAPGTQRGVFIRDPERRHRWSEIRLDAVTQASAEAPPIEVRIPAPREFTVEVRAPDGGPLAESVTPKMQLGEGWSWFEVARVREDRTSTTWAVGAADLYVLSIKAPGFAALAHKVTEQEIASGRLVVRLDPGVTVRGRIISTDPRAARDVQLSMGSDEAWRGHATRSGAPDDDGTFSFERVSAGVWTLDVSRSRAALAEREIHVAGGTDIDLGEISVPPSRVIRGVVQRPDGTPCDGALIDCFLAGAAANDHVVCAGEGGSFEIETVSLRGEALFVRRKGVGAAIVRLDETDPDKPLVVRLAPTGKLDVRIRLPRPQSSAWSRHVQTPDGVVRWQPDQEDRGDDKLGFDERFTWSGLAPGTIVVVIASTEWTYTATATVVAGATTAVVVGPDK